MHLKTVLAIALYALASPPGLAAEWGKAAPFASPFALLEPGDSATSAKLFTSPQLNARSFNGANAFSNETIARQAFKIDEKLLFGIETRSGTGFSSFTNAPFRGFEFNSTSLKLGYDLGNFTPYVATSLTTAKPGFGASSNFTSPFEAGIQAQNPAYSAKSAASISAGFNYAPTSNLQFGVGVTAGSNPGIHNSGLNQGFLRP